MPVLTVQRSDRELETEYRTVLLATDGREGSRRAMRYAIELAARYGATLHGLYVLDERLGRTSALRSMLEDEANRAKRDVTTAAARAGVDVATAIVDGTPHEEIVDYAEEHGIDLIVMGSTSRPRLERLFMGSVATGVVRTAPVPVLTVRDGHTPGRRGTRRVTRGRFPMAALALPARPS